MNTPTGGRPNRARALLALAILIGVSAAACAASVARPVTDAPWYSIVPPLLAVIAALLTGRMLASLLTAVFVGGWLSAWSATASPLATVGGGVWKAARFLWLSVMSPEFSILAPGSFRVTDSQLILLYVVLIMAAITVVLTGGGLQGVADWLSRFARGRRSAQVVTFLAGLAVFIDDYANTMIVGATMRPVTDRHRISREKLAFLVDATSAPVAGIALISTWIGYEVGLLGDIAGTLQIDRTGYAMFLDALGFRFYCITMIGFVMFNTVSGLDFGAMAAAERRASRHGKVSGDGWVLSPLQASSAEPSPGARIHAATALAPMFVMLGVFIGSMWFSGGGGRFLAADPIAPLRLSAWREVFSTAKSIPLLAWASGSGLVAACLFSLLLARISAPAILRSLWAGLKAATMPVSVLILAWSLKGACDELRTGEFLGAQLGGAIPPWLFPPLVFTVAGATSFSTGTSWGTMAILIPTAVPVAFALDNHVYGPVTVVTIAAILDGAIFGDHCSPISDTTIMSSAASACDHLAHVRTQLPYSLAVAGLALVGGYLPAGLGFGKWVGILGGASGSAAIFAAVWWRERKR